MLSRTLNQKEFVKTVDHLRRGRIIFTSSTYIAGPTPETKILGHRDTVSSTNTMYTSYAPMTVFHVL